MLLKTFFLIVLRSKQDEYVHIQYSQGKLKKNQIIKIIKLKNSHRK